MFNAVPCPTLIFDLDGTLSDPREGIAACLQHALQSVGAEGLPPERLESFIGPPLQQVLLALLGDEERARRALQAFRGRYGETGLFANQLYPGIVEALGALTACCTALFIATSKPRVYAERIVAHFGLTAFFRGIYGSELDGRRADKVELLAHLIREERLSPDAAVMIGDRAHDVRAARANGVRSIGVTWGFGSADELTAAGADWICHSVDELMLCVQTRPV